MLDKILNKFTLLQSLAVMIAFSLLLPVPILFGMYVSSTYQAKQEDFIAVSTKKFELSSDIFSESLWNFYPELGQTMVHQLSLDANFVSVRVVDTKGKIFISSINKNIKDKAQLFLLEKTLFKNGSDIGHITMEFKKEGLIESMKSDLLLFGSIVLMQAILIVIVISLIYYKKIIKPMKRLVYDSKKLASKELDEPFIWSGKDEINSLGRSLDRTRIALGELFKNLITQNETLDEKVKQRTQELEETSRYKSEFLANMSHEIRTPMNAIVGMCHLISKTHLDDAQSNYIIKIKDASSVLLRIINDILDFSKIEAGKLSIETIAFDLHKELKKSVSIFSILAKDKGIELESDFVHTHRFYRGDPYWIIQVINNFLSNAIKFSTDGKVWLMAKEEENRLILSVKDTGIGIADEKKDKLFQAFGQLDASTTRKHGGTGLGLYICTQLASMMGGKITFESELGKGSVFRLELALEKVDAIDVQRENGQDMRIPLHILLIEDDKNSRNILREFIRSFGFFVSVVESYEKALEKVAKEKFDLFIIDYHLPTIDGIKTYELLQSKLQNPVPAIMITVDDDANIKSRALVSGFERFLVKPINPSYLYDDITALCSIEKSNILIQHSKINFSDKSILLVEDNEINLEVAMYLLGETEASVDIARNGFEAVEKVRQKSYDAILMDIQMPVMDGYEATKIIRKELGYSAPIIAMTANVMAHDVQKCIEIGMNEHIGKPLEVEDFYGSLLRVFDKKDIQIHKPKEVQEDLCFDKKGALQRLSNNVPLWEKTFCKFCEKYKTLLRDIDALKRPNTRQELAIYIHSLKGLCGTIGANRLQKAAFVLEQELKSDRVFEEISFENIFLEYAKFSELIVQEFEQVCNKSKEETLDFIDQEDLLKYVQELALALDNSNLSTIKKTLGKLFTCKEILDKEAFKSIVISCENFDFEMALKYLAQLKKEMENV